MRPRRTAPLIVPAADVAWLMAGEPEVLLPDGPHQWVWLSGTGTGDASVTLLTRPPAWRGSPSPAMRTVLAADAPITVRLAVTSAGWTRPVEMPGRPLMRVVRPGWLIRHQLTWWHVVEADDCSGECPYGGRCSGVLRLHCGGRPVTQTHVDPLEYQEVCLPAATPVPAGAAGSPGPVSPDSGPGTPPTGSETTGVPR